MHPVKETAAWQGDRSEDQVLSVSESLSEIPVAPKPDRIGRARKKMMRDLKRTREFKMLHPNVRRTVSHAVMRHMHPEDGFFMDQAKFAAELGICNRETVNRHLKKAVELELFTKRSSGFGRIKRFDIHPRVTEGVTSSVTLGVTQGVTLKLCKEVSQRSAARKLRAEEQHEDQDPAAFVETPAAEGQERGFDWELAEASFRPGANLPVQAEASLRPATSDTGNESRGLLARAFTRGREDHLLFTTSSGTQHKLCKRCRVELVPGVDHICRDPGDFAF